MNKAYYEKLSKLYKKHEKLFCKTWREDGYIKNPKKHVKQIIKLDKILGEIRDLKLGKITSDYLEKR